jgi:IS30 family transposase
MGAKKLTPEERDEIARLHSKGCGVHEIARQTGRAPSTISVELRAGMWHDHNVHTSVYVAIHAQRLRQGRAATSSKQPKLTNAKHVGLRAYVEQKLREGFSPEQIAGRLPKDYPDDPVMRIGHEAIYRYIYAPEQAELKFWEYLPKDITLKLAHPREPGNQVVRRQMFW